MIISKVCCELLTRSVPIPDIMRFRFRHHVAFWKALSSTAPIFRANCCSRSVWLCASARLGSSGRGRKDAIIHADFRISTNIHAHEVGEPGWGLTEREDEAYAEEQDLTVLTTEECAVEVGIKRLRLPYTVTHASSIGPQVRS